MCVATDHRSRILSKLCVGRLFVLLLFAVAAGSTSCAPSTEEEPQLRSIASTRALYRGYPRLIAESWKIAGQVVSDDRYGQYIHRLAVQDESGGIFISIDHPELHSLHSLGDSIVVECRGMTIGGYGQSALLGGESSGESEVTPLSLSQWMLHHKTISHNPLPSAKRLTIRAIGAADMATRVRVCDVEIVEAGELWTTVAQSRSMHLVDSNNPTDTLLVRLSDRGDYYNALVPVGVVDVVGVVDYFGSDYQLLVASPSAVLEREEK